MPYEGQVISGHPDKGKDCFPLCTLLWTPTTDSVSGARSRGLGCRKSWAIRNPMERGAWWATIHRVAKESDMI